jgi:hypothetical protein
MWRGWRGRVIVTPMGKKPLIPTEQDAAESKCFKNMMMSRKPYSHI